jgi:hypothetical protein
MLLLLLTLVPGLAACAPLTVTQGDREAPPGYIIYYGGVGEAYDPRKHMGDAPNYDWGWDRPHPNLRVNGPSQSLTSITCVPANYGKDNNPRRWR